MGTGGAGTTARDFSYRGEARHDPHYVEWRDRRIAEFDRDYDEYRRRISRASTASSANGASAAATSARRSATSASIWR